MKMPVWIGSIGLAICFALLGGWKVVRVLFTEDLYCQKGSFEYFLTIDSNLIKEVPLLQIEDQPQFYYSCGDGPKPPANGIDYLSKETTEHLESKLTDYILRAGYRRDEDARNDGRIFRRRGDQVELFITPENGLSRVGIDERYFD